jgi:hypothetical protein
MSPILLSLSLYLSLSLSPKYFASPILPLIPSSASFAHLSLSLVLAQTAAGIRASGLALLVGLLRHSSLSAVRARVLGRVSAALRCAQSAE